MKLPDPNDRHVVAAGIAAGACVILTWNLRHFPAKELKKFGLPRKSPDEFLSRLYDEIPDLMIASLANARQKQNGFRPCTTPHVLAECDARRRESLLTTASVDGLVPAA